MTRETCVFCREGVLTYRRLGAERIILMGRHEARMDLGVEWSGTDVIGGGPAPVRGGVRWHQAEVEEAGQRQPRAGATWVRIDSRT